MIKLPIVQSNRIAQPKYLRRHQAYYADGSENH
jgi:hypothetical protein